MIRPADLATDLPALVRMGALFHAEATWPATLAPYDTASFAGACMSLASVGVLLAATVGDKPVGMASAAIAPLYFNNERRVAQEVFWYVAPEHRGGIGARLLLGLIEACRRTGAVALLASAMEGLRGDASGIYERVGFTRTETMFVKVLA